MKKGFTLIELLVVIAIIGVLASIVFSSLSNTREQAKLARFEVQARQFQTAMEVFYLDNGHYPYPEAAVSRDSNGNVVGWGNTSICPGSTLNSRAQGLMDELGQENEGYFFTEESFSAFDGRCLFYQPTIHSWCRNHLNLPGARTAQTYSIVYFSTEEGLNDHSTGDFSNGWGRYIYCIGPQHLR